MKAKIIAQARAIYYDKRMRTVKKQCRFISDYGLWSDYLLSSYTGFTCYLRSRGFNPYKLEFIGISGSRKTLLKVSSEIWNSMRMTIPEFEEYIRNY